MKLDGKKIQTYEELDGLLNGSPKDRLTYHLIFGRYNLYLHSKGILGPSANKYVTKKDLNNYLQQELDPDSLFKPLFVSHVLTVLQAMLGENMDRDVETLAKAYLVEHANKLFSLPADPEQNT